MATLFANVCWPVGPSYEFHSYFEVVNLQKEFQEVRRKAPNTVNQNFCGRHTDTEIIHWSWIQRCSVRSENGSSISRGDEWRDSVSWLSRCVMLRVLPLNGKTMNWFCSRWRARLLVDTVLYCEMHCAFVDVTSTLARCFCCSLQALQSVWHLLRIWKVLRCEKLYFVDCGRFRSRQW